MKEEIKQVAEAMISHPKSAIAVTTFFTSHVWMNYGLPAFQGLTTIVGFAVLVAVLIKHILDISKSMKGEDDSKGDR